MTEKKIEICVARYNENTDWLNNTQFNNFSKIIYNKGPSCLSIKTPEKCEERKLDNVGREGHTFLYHIINNYENLADVTIFLPGSYLCVCIYMYTCIRVYLCVHMCVCIYMYVCVFVFICSYVYLCVHMCVCVSLCIRV